MTNRRNGVARLLGWGVIVWSIASLAGMEVIVWWHWRTSETQAYQFGREPLFGLIPMTFVAAILVARQPRHSVTKALLAIVGFGGLQNLPGAYGQYALVARGGELPFGETAAWLANVSQTSFVMAMVALLWVFPDGQLPSRRWRFVFRSFLTGALLTVLSTATAPGALESEIGRATNPFGLNLPLLNQVLALGGTVLALSGLLGGVLSVVVKYRRSKGEQRLQLKWFAYAAVVAPLAIILTSFVPSSWQETAGSFAWGLGPASFPLAAGMAILRYRLYDIDVVINKTVVYGALAAFITLIYVGVVVGLGSLVGAGGQPNLGLSLAATAIVAVAFQPVRERVQRFANKLVYGERVTPYEAVTSFSHRMAESLSLEQVLPQMAEAAARGVGGVRSRVSLFLPGGGEQAVTWPPDASGNSFDRRLQVVHQAEQVGEIAVAKAPGEQITKSEDKLLQDLASQAGLAMRNLRLTGELQQKLVELQESRKRIVAAQDEERRRMERDIHDGAQQQLVSMAVKLGLARGMIGRDQQKANQILDELKTEAQDAVESVRDLARGLFPQVLVDRGLVEALQSHLDKMAIDALVQDELHGARFDLEVEANVYFCIREALQNASKHAPRARITIHLSSQDGHLHFAVKDEGSGFAPLRVKSGAGLQNMRDRVEALGGLFEIASSPGKGTIVTGHLPAKQLAESRT